MSVRVRRACSVLLAIGMLAITVIISGCSDAEGETAEVGSNAGQNVSITIECEQNLIFSTYDLNVYVDDEWQGTIDHGTSEDFELTLNDGVHVLRVAEEGNEDVVGSIDFVVDGDSSLKFEARCTSSQIEIEAVDELNPQISSEDEPNEGDPQESVEQVPEEDLNRLLSQNAMDASWFSSVYRGRSITFDGWVGSLMHHEDYGTRWDVLILPGDNGDYSTDLNFRLTNVNMTDMNVVNSDTLREGDNITITAIVGDYNSTSGWLELDPVSISIR